MHPALNSLAAWDHASDAERFDIAKQVGLSLPQVKDIELVPATYGYGVRPQGEKQRLTFHGIKRFGFGDQIHCIAQFVLNAGRPRKFCLIPGGTITLGYDRKSQKFPMASHERRWDEEFAEYKGLPSLREELDKTTTPLRTVTFGPFLIEYSTVGPGSGDFRPAEHDSVIDGLRDAGFLLPTSDQWEYAYSGGTRCMFPWGDALWPEYSDQELEHVSLENAFGLVLTTDSCVLELCAEPEITRGGDGGMALSNFGGMFYDIMWACPSFLNMDCERYNGRFRRVLPVN